MRKLLLLNLQERETKEKHSAILREIGAKCYCTGTHNYLRNIERNSYASVNKKLGKKFLILKTINITKITKEKYYNNLYKKG